MKLGELLGKTLDCNAIEVAFPSPQADNQWPTKGSGTK